MGLIFETPSRSLASAPARADVACFIGFVARRTASLPPFASEASLLTPVVVDSWEAFDRQFEWAARPVSAAAPGAAPSHCATWLGAAVRSFFAVGGRRAVIVRAGDPGPLLPDAALTDPARAARLKLLLGELAPFDPLTPASWRGLGHLYGLDEPAMVCLPDLPELYAEPPPVTETAAPELTPVPEHFVECSAEAEAPQREPLLRRIEAPALNAAGLQQWARAVAQVVGFLSRFRRDCILVGALPLCRSTGTGGGARHAQAAQIDPLSWLAASEQPQPRGMPLRDASSAFVQLGWPWLRTRASSDLPQGLEPPDGALAGMVAAGALAQGCYRSVAGRAWPAVVEGVPEPAWGRGPKAPWEQLAERVCVFAPGPGAWALQSDVTTSPDIPWRAGGTSRLIASVLRAARAIGHDQVFTTNGPATWAAVCWAMESLLQSYWQGGGLRGATPEEAFDVRCGPHTMTQADLDAGRLRVEVSVLPAAAMERITVVMALDDGVQSAALAREMV